MSNLFDRAMKQVAIPIDDLVVSGIQRTVEDAISELREGKPESAVVSLSMAISEIARYATSVRFSKAVESIKAKRKNP